MSMGSEEGEMRVAVMGATGSGKSTFINVASGSKLAVSDSLESCTINVETSTFSLDGKTVTLIDTPGFDDTTRSDTDVLKSITGYLSRTYSQGAKLAGVVYMQRISDNKMGGPSRKNFHIFRDLCGDDGLRNVLLVTNMWSRVDPTDGEARELELMSKSIFFKPALDKGSRMLRHDGSQTSAHTIIRQLVGRESLTLLVEDEMVNQGKCLADTTAGKGIMHELEEQAERHAEAVEDLCIGIEAATLEQDEETKQALQEEARKAREKIEKIRRDLAQMVSDFATENLRLANENRQYRKDVRRQRAEGDQKAQLLEREREAREVAEAGKRRAEAQLAAEREGWGHGRMEREGKKHEWQGREEPGHDSQEHERKEQERQERERQEHEKQERARQEREKQERERQERARQERERQERERQERERQGRERQERARQEHERQEREKQERVRLERERLERERREREWRREVDRAKQEQEKLRQDLEKLKKEKNSSNCVIQ